MNNRIETARHIAIAKAKEYYAGSVGGAHLLFGLLHDDVGLSSEISSINQDIHYLREWAEVRMELLPKVSKISLQLTYDSDVRKAMDMADLIRLQKGKDHYDEYDLLAALIKPGIAFSEDYLKSFPLKSSDVSKIEHQYGAGSFAKSGEEKENEVISTPASNNSKETPSSLLHLNRHIDQFFEYDLVEREDEVSRINEVVNRKTKPNILVVGEPGVGKTALVLGFLKQVILQNGDETEWLYNLWQLDTNELIAGASYKGEIEDRLNKVIQFLTGNDDNILFIDDFHVVVDPSGPFGASALNVLRSALNRGLIRVIAVTTVNNYQKIIERNESLQRYFEVIKLQEPNPIQTSSILKVVIPSFERHHNIQVAPDAILSAIQFAGRYLKERSLPDSAIDLIDQTMASVRIQKKTLLADIERIKEASQVLDSMDSEARLTLSAWMRSRAASLQITENLETILSHARNVPEDISVNHLQDFKKVLKERLESMGEEISSDHIAEIVGRKTGIPAGKLLEEERTRLLVMEEVLKERVVGQDHAIHSVCSAILESRAGLLKGGQPIGSFFFLGPTGTGKTELAKALAHFLFNDEKYLLRFDMSEFKEEHSAALLYGAPPGYVGYEEGGLLVNKIRQKPYSVVLFDEIEKAHPSVFDLFLQILDEGKMHDRLGREGDFSNALVLFTSNIGSDFIMKSFNEGNIPGSNNLMDIMSRHFRPEFLARLTEIVPFAPISEAIVQSIFNIHVSKLVKTLTEQGIHLAFDSEAKHKLALDGFNQTYGARPIKGVIRNQLRRPIARKIVRGEIQSGDMVLVHLSGQGIAFAVNGKKADEEE